MPTELRNAGEFEACPRYDDNEVRRTFCRLDEIFLVNKSDADGVKNGRSFFPLQCLDVGLCRWNCNVY